MRIKRENEHKKKGSGFVRSVGAVFAAMVLTWCCSFVSLADSTGTVKVESATIRESTDTSSNAVGSASKGTTVTIKDEVTDASGTLWYQIDVDSSRTGYVRADLIEKTGGGSAAADNGGQTDAVQADGGAAATGTQAESAMDAQYAVISVAVAKIRSAPSTNDSIVDSLSQDTQVIVSGQSNGSSDGRVWYFVTFTGTDGSQKTGFVRSDLITLGDMVPVPEEQPEPEEQPVAEPEEPAYQDYELVFKDGEWCLIDHIGGGYEYKLQPLLDAHNLQNDTMDEDARKLVRQRIAIVALGVVAGILLIVVIIMAIKLRDAYYEDYEEDEDDDEEDEGEEEDGEEEEEEAPVRRSRRAEPAEPASRRSSRMPDTAGRRPVRAPEGRTAQTGEIRKESAAKQRKAKNFLLDDDDFEFEFLNMDDKDL